MMRRIITAIVLAATATLTAPAAIAASLPYSDSGATGYIGFCNAQGKQITSGLVNAQPFVYKAVSSVPPPLNYGGVGQKVTLHYYQPRLGVPAQEWTGYQMTGTSAYTNKDRPATVATKSDPPLLWPLQTLPAHWDNLVEMRLYFSIPGAPVWVRTYPVANLQISGNSWHQIDPKPISCSTGTVISDEQALLPPSTVNRTVSAPPASISAPSKPLASGIPTTHPSASPSASPLVASSSSPSGPSTSSIVVLIVAVVLFAGTAVFWWRTRSKSSGSAA
jgi:hypothetical protein